MPKHQNFFATNLTSGTLAGATTTPLNSIPTCDAPFYLTLDATGLNSHQEVIYVTSKTATNVNHDATTYAHTTSEEVRMDVVAEELDSLYDAKLGMSSQAIINGNFNISQRGTSFTPVDATAQLTLDKWKDYVTRDGGTLPTLSLSQNTLTPGDIYGSSAFVRLTTDGAGTSLGVSSNFQFFQPIEFGTRFLAGDGKYATISFWARSSISNKRIGIGLTQTYGTGGTPTSDEIIKPDEVITLTSSWVKYTKTFALNTLVGKTFGTNGNDALIPSFWYQWGTTIGATYLLTGVTAESYGGSGTIDIAQVQLCSGDVALPFQPVEYGQELRSCQRYCVGINTDQTLSVIANGNALSTTVAHLTMHLPVEMRSVPTPTVTASDWQLYDGATAATDVTALSLLTNSNQKKAVVLAATVASGLTQWRPYRLQGDGTTPRTLLLEADL
jgi:hypothetical protein